MQNNDKNEFLDFSYLKDDELIFQFNELKLELTNFLKKFGDELKKYSFMRQQFDSFLNEISKRNMKIEL